MLLGYYVNNTFKKCNNILIISIAIMSFIITYVIQYWSYNNNISYTVWYNFAPLFICATCLFGLFKNIKEKDERNIFIRLTKYISRISLGIFFVHMIFLKLLIKYIEKFNFKNPIETIVLFILSSILSVVFIFILSKIKILREKVFLIKDKKDNI